jgi:PIN domain nuclease of toxin-antitoxin system
VSGFLLDSHVALWWLAAEPLSPRASAAIADPARPVLVSMATAWEIAIKQALEKLRVADDYLDVLVDRGVGLLAIEPPHTRAVRDLPHHHRDPFDRMLVAQAQVERLTLVTRDERLRRYDVRVLAA